MIKNFQEFLWEQATFTEQLKNFYRDLFIKGAVLDEWRQHNWAYGQNMSKMKDDQLNLGKKDFISQVRHDQEWWDEQNFTSLLEVRNRLKDLWIAIYYQLMLFATYYNQPKFRPGEILPKFKRLFDYGQAREFIRNLPAGINALVIQMGRKSNFSAAELAVIQQNPNPFLEEKLTPTKEENGEEEENEEVKKLVEKLNNLKQNLSLLIKNDILGAIYRKLSEIKTT